MGGGDNLSGWVVVESGDSDCTVGVVFMVRGGRWCLWGVVPDTSHVVPLSRPRVRRPLLSGLLSASPDHFPTNAARVVNGQ